MKNKRLILTIIFMAITFCFLMPTEVDAADIVEDNCINKKTCMVVCNYDNVRKGKLHSRITIYYFFDGRWMTKWQDLDGPVSKRGPLSIAKAFKDDRYSLLAGLNIYTEKEISEENFVCPKNGYFDLNSWSSGNEVCFDENGKYCEGKSNIGTSFGKKAESFVSQKKDYDYATEMKKYFEKWIVADWSCEELANNASDINRKISDKMYDDFKTNFLYGNKIPTFIENNKNFKSGVSKAVKVKKQECQKEITDKVSKGEMDAETGEKLKQQIDDIDPNDVQDAIDNIHFNIDDYNKPQDCEGILGDPTDKNSLAYLIQTILNYIKIIGPILVVLLSSFDFVKVIWTSDDESMKKAQQKLGKRLVAAVLLFLLPLLINIMFNLINDSIVDPTCGIK